MEALGEQFLIGGPWSLPVYGKGLRPPSSWTVDAAPLKGFQCSSSDCVLVLWFWGVGRQDFGSLVQLEIKVLSTHASAAYSFGLLSLKSKSVSF